MNKLDLGALVFQSLKFYTFLSIDEADLGMVEQYASLLLCKDGYVIVLI